jgi:hypothetical protein
MSLEETYQEEEKRKEKGKRRGSENRGERSAQEQEEMGCAENGKRWE